MSATTAPDWLRTDVEQLAVDKLLDAAGEAFARHGITRARMDDVADAAGCSRATVYRYFAGRDELRQAYVARETLRLGQDIGRRIGDVDDPRDRLVHAVVLSLAAVRRSPALVAWFSPENLGTATALATGSQVIDDLVAGFVDRVLDQAAERGLARPGLDRDGAVEWVMRAMLSLLMVQFPAPRDPDEEAEMLRAFLIPALFREA